MPLRIVSQLHLVFFLVLLALAISSCVPSSAQHTRRDSGHAPEIEIHGLTRSGVRGGMNLDRRVWIVLEAPTDLWPETYCRLQAMAGQLGFQAVDLEVVQDCLGYIKGNSSVDVRYIKELARQKGYWQDSDLVMIARLAINKPIVYTSEEDSYPKSTESFIRIILPDESKVLWQASFHKAVVRESMTRSNFRTYILDLFEHEFQSMFAYVQATDGRDADPQRVANRPMAGLLQSGMDYPRVMIIPCRGQQISPVYRAAETQLIDLFAASRFTVVDLETSRNLHRELTELVQETGEIDTAARIGLEHHAELVVYLEVVKGRALFDGVMRQATVTVRTKVVATTTAQFFTAKDAVKDGVGNSSSLAFENAARSAAENVAEPLKQSLFNWWSDYTRNGTPYLVTLQGPNLAGPYCSSFERAIADIPGVVSVTERLHTGNLAELLVVYKGKSRRLKADILEVDDNQEWSGKLMVVLAKGRFLILSLE